MRHWEPETTSESQRACKTNSFLLHVKITTPVFLLLGTIRKKMGQWSLPNWINTNNEIYTKDFPVKQDSFNCDAFHGFLPVSNMFSPFHNDDLLVLTLGKPVISCLQSLAQRQTSVRQVMTCYHEIKKLKKMKRQGREKRFTSPSEAATLFGYSSYAAASQFYFTLLETEKSRAVQYWLLTQLCSCPLFLSY